MKIITNKNLLLNSINIVQKSVPTKTTLPILEGILLEAKNGKLKLTGTDLEIGIETILNVDVIIPGKTVISAKILGEIVRKLPDADIELELKENNIVHIKCEKSNFKIKSMSAEEFPNLPIVNKENPITITQNNLKEMIRQTIFAVSADEIRPILTGVLFEVINDKASMVALDGFRMAVKSCCIINDSNLKAVIPGKSLSEIGKILEDIEEPVNIYFSKNQILVHINETIIICRLLEGEFINYKQILPNDYKIKVKIQTSKLIESCERAALFAKDSSNNMIKFEINEDVMSIKSNSQYGDVQEELKIVKDGEDIEIAFNVKYFMEVLKVIQADYVSIEFTTNISPSILRPIDDTGYLYLVLPSRFKK